MARRAVLLLGGVLAMLSSFLLLRHLRSPSSSPSSASPALLRFLGREEEALLRGVQRMQRRVEREVQLEAEALNSLLDASTSISPSSSSSSGQRPPSMNQDPVPVKSKRRPGEGPDTLDMSKAAMKASQRPGQLKCRGEFVESEVIYWKRVPGDDTYESPITPHHGVHHDRYLTYEYDEGGWNNIRMGMECIMVIAHAMGRTLVVPPKENLYLLDKKQKGQKKAALGFDDFFDIDLLKSHQGYHVISTEQFLEREALTGGLHGVYPPKNRSDLSGPPLHKYLRSVADVLPAWRGKFLVMPDVDTDLSSFNLSALANLSPEVRARMKKFGGERSPVFYDKTLVKAHHIHFRSGPDHRVLQHHYAFSFFSNSHMQSFYRRFVRDYLRYKDEIQCAGDEVLRMVRADAIAHNSAHGLTDRPHNAFYSLHIRRGDFQFKEVKIGADEIVKNLVVDGKSVIPPKALVYISTDDPEGVCKGCRVQRIPCEKYEKGQKPVGCPEDPSWDAFRRAGWELRFLGDYLQRGALGSVNTNVYGMIESIVCSKSTVFAGTYFSTFSGYIHRLRGYHGIGEDTYYHSARHVLFARMKKSVGHGFSREWRAGWTDDEGAPI